VGSTTRNIKIFETHCGLYNPQFKKNFKNELRVVEPAMYFYKIFWLVGSTTRSVKILRKYSAVCLKKNLHCGL